MDNAFFDVVIIGAGVAGLSASYHLKERGLSHIVLERGKIGESWRSQRWDSFRLNSLNKFNTLAGAVYKGADQNGFDTAAQYISAIENYVSKNDLPVVENSKVVSVEKPSESFNVTVSSNERLRKYSCSNVIVATGHASEIKIPTFAKNIARGIKQLHTSEYRNADQLPAGAVLVVGSAQSGVQIAEDLADAGSKVYLSTSMVARVPRWYRGRDIMEWLIEMKFFEMQAKDIKDPAMLNMKPPQITGVGGSRYTISLQSLAKKGVILVGKTENADAYNVFFQPNAAMHIRFADQFSKNVKEMIDGFITQMNLNAEPAQVDEADMPDEQATSASSLASLNFEKDNIGAIIWATGFGNDFSFIKLAVFDDDGGFKLKEGMSVVPGLYVVGYPWLRGRKSALIFGIKDDAQFVVDAICSQSVVKEMPVAVGGS